jgi:hypothetical protein
LIGITWVIVVDPAYFVVSTLNQLWDFRAMAVVALNRQNADQQRAVVDELNGVIRQTDEYRRPAAWSSRQRQ